MVLAASNSSMLFNWVCIPAPTEHGSTRLRTRDDPFTHLQKAFTPSRGLLSSTRSNHHHKSQPQDSILLLLSIVLLYSILVRILIRQNDHRDHSFKTGS